MKEYIDYVKSHLIFTVILVLVFKVVISTGQLSRGDYGGLGIIIIFFATHFVFSIVMCVRLYIKIKNILVVNTVCFLASILSWGGILLVFVQPHNAEGIIRYVKNAFVLSGIGLCFTLLSSLMTKGVFWLNKKFGETDD